MCELCGDETVEWTWIDVTGADQLCEYTENDDLEECGEPARWRRQDRYVEQHLCETHGREEAQMLEEGLMDAYQAMELSDGVTLKEINEPVKCDSPVTGGTCREPAKYASVTIDSTFLCEMHRDA